MSRKKSREQSTRPGLTRRQKMEAVGLALFGVFAVVFVIVRIHGAFAPVVRESAVGAILETRIATLGNADQAGGYALYQLEARVQYPVDGQQRDRWIPASGATTDEASLRKQLASLPRTCTVYWARYHEDVAHCVLKRASK